MNWKEFFKPTRGKLIFSIVVTLLWILLMRYLTFINLSKISCSFCSGICPEGNYANYLLVPAGCNCCVSLSDVFYDYIWLIVVPFVVSYFIYSTLSMFLFKKKK